MRHGSRKSEPERPLVPPLAFHPPSNGEFCPSPPTALALRRQQRWREVVERTSRRLGMTRRAFAESACGTAAWLLVMNQVACSDGGGAGSGAGSGGAGGARGGGAGTSGSGGTADAGVVGQDVSGFEVDGDMAVDQAQARERLVHDPFVFDVQTHISFDEITPWPPSSPPQKVLDFLKRIWVSSNTTVACVSGVPATRPLGAANVEARVHLRELMDRLGGPRLLFHCNANPELPGEPDYMAEVAGKYKGIAAWKVYPHSQAARGLDHPDFEPFLQRARELDIKLVAAHRGISTGGDYNSAGSPKDVVLAAKKTPDLNFLVYHAGWEASSDENHPYSATAPEAELRGVDRFIRALKNTGIGKDGNVYAELGSTWANLIMRGAEGAAHVLGKLLAQLGPDRVLWGTDCVFNDGPQGQIDAFWTFVISAQLQQQFGYPALTEEVRRKVLGLNAARLYGVDVGAVRYAVKGDEIDRLKMAWRDDPRAVPMPHPSRHTGPRSRREFIALLRRERAT